MSKLSFKEECENVAKDEYEIQLYGFSLDQFAKENLGFVEHRISKAMRDLSAQLSALVEKEKPELIEQIKAISKSTTEDIQKFCRENISDVNDAVVEHLRIPDNVLLISDHAHSENRTKEEFEDLKAECEKLEEETKANAVFIIAMHEEEDLYEKLGEIEMVNEISAEQAQEQLGSIIETDLLFATAVKVLENN